MSAARKLTGDRKKVYKALVHLKKTDDKAYRRALKKVSGGPIKNPPETNRELESLVEKLETAKIQAAYDSKEIQHALKEMKQASPKKRVELMRRRYEAGVRKKRAEKDIENLVRKISLETAKAQGRIVDTKAQRIADLSMKAEETSDRLEALNAKISELQEARLSKKPVNVKELLALYGQRDNLLRISENISKQQMSLSRGISREMYKAEFAANDELEKAGVDEPGAARILAQRIEVLTKLESATGAKAKQLRNELAQIDKNLERVSEIYKGHLSAQALRDISKTYADLGPGVSRQLALRNKLEERLSSRGRKTKEEISQIKNRLIELNQELGDSMLDAFTRQELQNKKRTLEQLRDERRLEARVLEIVEEAAEQKFGFSEKKKRERYEPEDKELYAVAEEIIEVITETAKSVGRQYANCLRAMETVWELTAQKDRALLNKAERQALKALGKQRAYYLALIRKELEAFKKSMLVSRVRAYGQSKSGAADALAKIMKLYFGLTPSALGVVTLRKAERAGDADVTDLKKIVGSSRNCLGAAYVYGIMMYLGELPTFEAGEDPQILVDGVFVYPPFTHTYEGLQVGYKGIRASRRPGLQGKDLMPPFDLMEAYNKAYNEVVKERMWIEAKGKDRRAQVAMTFIRSGFPDLRQLAVVDDDGRMVKNTELNDQEKASRSLYYDVHGKARTKALDAAEKEAERTGKDWRLPTESRVGDRGFLGGGRLPGYKEWRGYTTEYRKLSTKGWASLLRKNKKNATLFIYTDLLGGQMLGDLAEAARTGSFGGEQGIDYFGLGEAPESESFTFTDVVIRPPIFESKIWTIARPGGQTVMAGYLEKDRRREQDVRGELAWAVEVLASAVSGRPLGDGALDWILLRKPWIRRSLAESLKADIRGRAQSDLDELAEYVEGLPEDSPLEERSRKTSSFESGYIYGKLERLNKEALEFARADLDRARTPLEKLRAQADVKASEREYARVRGYNTFANKMDIQERSVAAGSPYWTYILKDIESGKPLAMGYAKDQAGAVKMARKRDKLLSEVWNSRDGRQTKVYSELSDKERRVLTETKQGVGKYQPIYFTPEIFQALVPTREEVEKIGESTYRKLKKRSALFTPLGDLKKTGVEAPIEDEVAMLPKSKGTISSFEPDDDEANYTIEVKAVKPGQQYEVRAVFRTIDEGGDVIQSPTPWVTPIGTDLKSMKSIGRKLAKKYRGSTTGKELEKNPALCKCLITGEYMAGVRNGSESFMQEYEQNPKKAISKYTRKKNPASDVTDIFEGADFSSATQAIPAAPEEAYKVGYSEGIIAGLDLCGVKNYFARKRLKRDYEKAILEARKRMRERRTGIRLGRQVAQPVVEQVEEPDDFGLDSY